MAVPEICAITGHSHGEANAILEAHYLHRDPALAWSAIRKLEMGLAQAGEGAASTDGAGVRRAGARTKSDLFSQTGSQTGGVVPLKKTRKGQ
jgi:hypothetical protein